MEPWAAILIGLAAGVVCFAAVQFKVRKRFDDSLDVVGVHLVGGLIGALLTGVFASTAINTVSGGIEQLGKQAIAAWLTLVFSFVATLAILKLIDVVVGVRVTEDEEEEGLDLSQHGESGYGRGEPSTAVRTLTETRRRPGGQGADRGCSQRDVGGRSNHRRFEGAELGGIGRGIAGLAPAMPRRS